MHPTVGGEQDFRLSWGPVNRGYSPIDLFFVSKHELFLKLATTLESVIVLSLFFFGKKLFHEVKLSAKGALDQPRCVLEEALEVRCFNDLLCFGLRKFGHFLLLNVFLLLAFWTELVFLGQGLLVHAT